MIACLCCSSEVFFLCADSDNAVYRLAVLETRNVSDDERVHENICGMRFGIMCYSTRWIDIMNNNVP